MAEHDDTWMEYSQHVLRSLERMSVNLEKLNTQIELMNGRLVALEVRSAIWGATGGMVVGAVVAFVMNTVLK